MKSTGICPKCSSKKLAIIKSEFGTYNQIKIDKYDLVNLTRYICSTCGYIEQYVADEESLTYLQKKITLK